MIGFLNPAWLWALPAGALPLILHLVARRQPPTVPFPAVRYLQQVTRDHQRRLKLQHWLLLLARTLLVLTLILAAAGPTVAREGLPSHAPASLVIVLDNSPSSGAIAGGTQLLEGLRQAALGVLARATADDAVWLITADGVARRGSPGELRTVVSGLTTSDIRLDLGVAIGQARDLLADDGRPAEIVLLSDLQASALSSVAGLQVPMLVGVPEVEPPANLGIAVLDPGPQPWSPGDNRVRLWLVGDSGHATPLTVQLGSRVGRPQLASVGAVLESTVRVSNAGWWPLTAQLDQDEFRADDLRRTLVRVLPIAEATWDPSDRYLAAAAATLREGGRLRNGSQVSLGWLGAGPSVVQPPADLAAVGAINRALERRAIPWRFGGPVLQPQMSDSGRLIGEVRVSHRLRLVYAGGAARGIEATVAGDPWIVRAGNVVLLGSRLDPSWTSLPTSAGFVPLVDALANRMVRGEQAVITGTPGVSARLPDAADNITDGARAWPVEGGASWRPPATGIYLVREGADTIAALAVNLDPRESELARSSRAQVEALWPSARLVPLSRVRDAAFGAGARGHLRSPLLMLALLLGLVEVGLASFRSRSA